MEAAAAAKIRFDGIGARKTGMSIIAAATKASSGSRKSKILTIWTIFLPAIARQWG
ncbi:hypothetical protein [Rhizobium sp. BK602]|uniref:hypothetical protein n=1 Tax=Rhizobium sp. BK602 TaxID=2586986 RepID=UPI0016216DBD|nr:hypothetical protein [Rhizobium sp. BK602]MBB3612909.1 hypothetical protein [Rhizobium sp. BK602]